MFWKSHMGGKYFIWGANTSYGGQILHMGVNTSYGGQMLHMGGNCPPLPTPVVTPLMMPTYIQNQMLPPPHTSTKNGAWKVFWNSLNSSIHFKSLIRSAAFYSKNTPLLYIYVNNIPDSSTNEIPESSHHSLERVSKGVKEQIFIVHVSTHVLAFMVYYMSIIVLTYSAYLHYECEIAKLI